MLRCASSVTTMSKVSIGIALYPVDGPDIDMLFKHADVAMYHAKEGGRNGYRFFSPQMKDFFAPEMGAVPREFMNKWAA